MFLGALDLADPAERAAYLDGACGRDAELRRRVEGLLAAHFRSGAFLEEPPTQLRAAARAAAPPINKGSVPLPATLSPKSWRSVRGRRRFGPILQTKA